MYLLSLGGILIFFLFRLPLPFLGQQLNAVVFEYPYTEGNLTERAEDAVNFPASVHKIASLVSLVRLAN